MRSYSPTEKCPGHRLLSDSSPSSAGRTPGGTGPGGGIVERTEVHLGRRPRTSRSYPFGVEYGGLDRGRRRGSDRSRVREGSRPVTGYRKKIPSFRKMRVGSYVPNFTVNAPSVRVTSGPRQCPSDRCGTGPRRSRCPGTPLPRLPPGVGLLCDPSQVGSGPKSEGQEWSPVALSSSQARIPTAPLVEGPEVLHFSGERHPLLGPRVRITSEEPGRHCSTPDVTVAVSSRVSSHRTLLATTAGPDTHPGPAIRASPACDPATASVKIIPSPRGTGWGGVWEEGPPDSRG